MPALHRTTSIFPANKAAPQPTSCVLTGCGECLLGFHAVWRRHLAPRRRVLLRPTQSPCRDRLRGLQALLGPRQARPTWPTAQRHAIEGQARPAQAPSCQGGPGSWAGLHSRKPAAPYLLLRCGPRGSARRPGFVRVPSGGARPEAAGWQGGGGNSLVAAGARAGNPVALAGEGTHPASPALPQLATPHTPGFELLPRRRP